MPWPFTHLLLVRHGDTEWNRAGRRQGQLDSPLTAAGRRHADRAAFAVARTTAHAIFCSPLGRARETARFISEGAGLAARVLDELAEVHHGAYAGLTDQAIETSYPGELARRAQNKYSWRFPQGESYEDADHRAVALELIAQSGPALPIVVTHEMIGRMLLRRLLDIAPAEALTRSFAHGAVMDVSLSRGTATKL